MQGHVKNQMAFVHNLKWNKCEGNQWCNLFRLDLSHSYFQGIEGVYVLWSGGEHPRTLYVGQGNIVERLTEHRRTMDTPALRLLGVFVTWAEVPQQDRDWVEGYLAEQLQPARGERHPDLVPSPPESEVNLPWY